MQVEGSNSPSNGRLTMSLIAPIAETPLPKPVFLGTMQRGNGKVQHRIGTTIELTNNDIELASLQELTEVSLANGRVPVDKRNEHLHLYGESLDTKGLTHLIHVIVENAPSGKVVAEIAATSVTPDARRSVGYAYEPGSIFSNISEPTSLEVLSTTKDNIIALKTYDGTNHMINIGKIITLVSETGTIDRSTCDYATRRVGESIRLYSRSDAEIDAQDPFHTNPFLTIDQYKPAWKFNHPLVPETLSPRLAAGHIDPVSVNSPNIQSSSIAL